MNFIIRLDKNVGNEMTESNFDLWVVYDHPSDFPNSFVARRWNNGKPTAHVFVSPRLDKLRTLIGQEISKSGTTPFCLPRDTNDDPSIMEVWI